MMVVVVIMKMVVVEQERTGLAHSRRKHRRGQKDVSCSHVSRTVSSTSCHRPIDLSISVKPGKLGPEPFRRR